MKKQVTEAKIRHAMRRLWDLGDAAIPSRSWEELQGEDLQAYGWTVEALESLKGFDPSAPIDVSKIKVTYL
jgi:hypothetical protein